MADKNTTKLITSGNPEIINSRFVVKASIMNNGVHPESIMLVIHDLLENGFSIKFFKSKDDVAGLLKLLQAASE